MLCCFMLQTKVMYGAVMFVGMLAPSAYFAANIKNYRGEIVEH